MSNVLGTTFEISLRCLLVLEVLKNKGLTPDMITAIDFIAVYGKDFGISDENLHGDNNFKFSEFAFRGNKVNKALKKLVLDGFVIVEVIDSGFSYASNDRGLEYCMKLESDYANVYRDLIQKTLEFISSKSEREVIELITLQSITSARKGGLNG